MIKWKSACVVLVYEELLVNDLPLEGEQGGLYKLARVQLFVGLHFSHVNAYVMVVVACFLDPDLARVAGDE